mmetsp:Transcript_7654/g.21581  ORF Transcript_7654/g.21581 Transcript_7654/m.21581 type:complete len:214 (+) Transcript_7654:337-978(+)
MLSQEQQPCPKSSGLKRLFMRSLSEAGSAGEAMRFGCTSRRQRSSPPSLAVTRRNISAMGKAKVRPPRTTFNGGIARSRTEQSQMKRPPAAVSTPHFCCKVSMGNSARRNASNSLGGTNKTWFVPVSTRNRTCFVCSPPMATPPEVTQKLRWAPGPAVPRASGMSRGSAGAQASVPGSVEAVGSSPSTMWEPLPSCRGTRAMSAGRPCSWSRW